MKWWKRAEPAAAAPAQLRSGEHHPFQALSGFLPMRPGELRLYRAVREAVPVVDAAIYKLIRMTGGARAVCTDAQAQADSRDGTVRDFVAVGDVGIRVIGGDAPVLDSQVPVRQILEQIVAKTGIPPFMLGLSWSSTERMSTQQADLLTTEITAIRRSLTPAVERICRMWLRMHGYGCGVEVVWEDINLQDLVEESKAELYREQARRLRIENDQMEARA